MTRFNEQEILIIQQCYKQGIRASADIKDVLMQHGFERSRSSINQQILRLRAWGRIE